MTARRARGLWLAFALCLAVWPLPAAAADPLPPDLGEIDFDQRLNAAVPLDLPFVDESGRPVRLGDYFDGQPVILTLNYLHCPNFCTLVMDGVAERLDEVQLEAGQDFRIVTVSIDPRERPELAAGHKDLLARHYPAVGQPGAWQFLTGEAEAIEQLTQAVGFRYAYDPASGEFAHPAGIIILTPEGRVARYLYGVDFPARDMRLALVEAAENRIGTAVDQFLLRCYRYDPATGRYNLAVLQLMRFAGVATVVGLAGLVLWLRGHERRPNGAGPGQER